MDKSNSKHENNTGKNNDFSPTQQLYSPNSIDQLQYKPMFNPSYPIPPDQEEEDNAVMESRYHWQNSPNLTMNSTMQQLNPSQAFNTIYDTSSYASPQQSHNVINGQYNYHHHRGSLPIIPTTSDSFMPSMEEEEEVDMTGAPYVRRHTESSIPSKQTHRKQKNSQSKKSMAMEGNEEERRKHFLERNRQAALKCRQRKKQWLADLQHRVEFLSTDNEQLQSQATMLREEVINLKTLLLAHRDCRVAQSNGTTMGMIQSISSNLTMPFHSTGVITPNTDMMMASEIVHSQPQ